MDFATGEVAQFYDRNGTLYHYYFDALGRQFKDIS